MKPPTITDEHRADVERFGRDAFTNIDTSLRLFNSLGRPGNNWQKWEWPRRLAALEPEPVQETLL